MCLTEKLVLKATTFHILTRYVLYKKMRKNIENIGLQIEFPEHYPDEIIETDIKSFLESGIKVDVTKKESN